MDFKTLIFMGPTGIGKTFSSKKITHDFFYTEMDFKQQLSSQNLILRGHEDYRSDIKLYPLEMLRKKEVVIYDDYGSCNLTEAYIEKMLYWLARLDEADKKTIITTNLNLEQMKKRDQRIFSRLMLNAKVLNMNGANDMRLKNTKVLNF